MLYIHIPFCKQKCSYCNFHFSTSLKLKDAMLDAIKKEIELRKDELNDKRLKSLYFGGGTPSVLSGEDIARLIDEVLKYFSFDENIEITLEANPDDLDSRFLKQLSQTPINRLSIGTQSFYDEDLKLMNRAHDASQAEDSIKRAQDFGFQNLSIDLIYGSPTSNFEIWKGNLQKTIALEIPHISSYALTVEPKTALSSWVKSQKVKSPEEQLQNEAFHYMSDFLKENGFIHYEISNFSLPNFESKHNSAYWKYQEYLGIGPSAHSYNGCDRRSWNVANNTHYIQAIEGNRLALETEILSEKDRFNEMLMIGLRTIWGVDLQQLAQTFSEEVLRHYQKEVQAKIADGLLVVEDNYLKIPEKHWFLADGIASDLFLV
ncbi:oxygen-independent coproporphyrinogen-3 oxidase [Bergeyella porcorum]|uniref:Heme chaperone HemW n=1 Tax=Bergeyella porcorum TaxID=1735111 RepID=A0AAU0EZL9_9FLAO